MWYVWLQQNAWGAQPVLQGRGALGMINLYQRREQRMGQEVEELLDEVLTDRRR
jgi:hypothetical protein